ncbi:MAG: helix-turn-helix domain-containing protein [Nitrospira sp.]|nr:helix-turn-helix domain-containing protein [Nitrospira sp.]
MTQQATRGLLSPRAASRFLGIDPDSVRRAIRAKRLRAVRYGRRLLISMHEVRRYAKARRGGISQ